MKPWNFLENPTSLHEGQTYSLLQPGRGKRGDKWSQVTFLAYTSCPADVIVRLADGSQLRCSRAELYEVEPGPPGEWKEPVSTRFLEE